MMRTEDVFTVAFLTREGKIRRAAELYRDGINAAHAILENRARDLAFLVELQQARVFSGTETQRLATSPEAVSAGLRALKQTAERSKATSAPVVDLLPP